MAMEIITKEDLEAFGDKLISQMRALLSSSGGLESGEPRKFLKSYQVKNLLKISPNTLQSLRKNGTLPFSRVGGIIYYKYEDVMNVLKGNTVPKKSILNGRQSSKSS